MDGTYRHLLVVRDMASGYQLLALPAPRAASELTAQALTGLFHEHGPPLVIKSDNDSAFRGAQTQRTLLDWKVLAVQGFLLAGLTPSHRGGQALSHGERRG